MKQSQRTKNRLREHNNHALREISRKASVPGITGLAVLFSCSCNWVGWLPANELESDNA